MRGRSADSGTTRRPAPARGACSPGTGRHAQAGEPDPAAPAARRRDRRHNRLFTAWVETEPHRASWSGGRGVLYPLEDMTVSHASYRRFLRVRAQSASTGGAVMALLCSSSVDTSIYAYPTRPTPRGRQDRRVFPQAWHRPLATERNGDPIVRPRETRRGRRDRDAAHLAGPSHNHSRRSASHTLQAIADRAEGVGTGQLTDLAYAFACLEAARRGVLPGTPPPPKNSAPEAIPPRRPTSSPQPSPTNLLFDTSR